MKIHGFPVKLVRPAGERNYGILISLPQPAPPYWYTRIGSVRRSPIDRYWEARASIRSRSAHRSTAVVAVVSHFLRQKGYI